MPTGSIVFDHTKSKAAIANHQLSLMERIVDQKTIYGHSSKGLSVDVVVKGMPKIVTKISHINPDYKEENFSLRNYLYSDIYKLNLIKLITPANQDVLKKHLGVNWLEILQNKYTAIERQLHDEAMETHAGIIAEGGMLRFARTAMTSFSQNLVSDDHSDASIHEEIFRRNKWEKMGGDRKLLCSEFVGKTLIASIYELNDGLIRELGEQGIKVEKLLNSPIDQKETLSILTPERLLTCLKKNGVVEMVAPISELSQFIVKGGDETAGVSMKAALQAQKSVFLALANSMSDDESPENGDQKQNNSKT